MKYINANGYSLEIGSILESSLAELLEEIYVDSKKVIIVDENTHEHCLGYLMSNYGALSEAEIVILPVGEDNKQMSVSYSVWEALTEYGIGRHDLIINLGGGVITDMGGFIASCYKRGCDFINIPTSLLAMVDASIGGKTGINLGQYKNQIGLFSNPVAVFVDIIFIHTLSAEEIKSGYAEMLKHGLIDDPKLFEDVLEQMKNPKELDDDLMERCIAVKNKIVEEDPVENDVRKILNFGHTIGHGIEGHFMTTNPISHGHAVAIGMVMESFLSLKLRHLSKSSYDKIENAILPYYQLPEFSDKDIQAIIELMRNDKKNKLGKIQCCLLNEIGQCSYDHEIDEALFLEIFLHFKNKQINLN